MNLMRLEDRTVPNSSIVNLANSREALSPELLTKFNLIDHGETFVAGDGSITRLYRENGEIAIRLQNATSALSPSQTIQDPLTQIHRLQQRGEFLQGYSIANRINEQTFILRAASSNVTVGPVMSVPHTSEELLTILSGQRGDSINWVSPVYQNSMSGTWMVPLDEVIVSLKPGVTAESYFAGNHDFSGYRPLWGTPDQFVATVNTHTGMSAVAISKSLERDSRLNWATPNFYQDLHPLFSPNDALFPDQWHLNQGTDADIDAPEAWDINKGAGVTIAIVDTGIELTHPDLAANIYKNAGEIPANGKDDDGNGWIDDVNGWDFTPAGSAGDNDPTGLPTVDWHGTATSGLAAAVGDNTIGTVGVAFQSKILPVRIFGDFGGATDDAGIAAALNYAGGRTKDGLGQWNGAQVLSNSWGGGALTASIEDALTWNANSARGGKGNVVVFAAGNGGTVQTPATLSTTLKGFIAASGILSDGTYSGYAKGPAVTLVAPTWNGGGATAGIITTDRTGFNGYNQAASPGGDYSDPASLFTQFGGTSASAPITAGVAAMALSLNPNLTNEQVRGLLKNTTDLVGVAADYDLATGRGDTWGTGRVNAFTAASGVGKAEVQLIDGITDVADGSGTVTVNTYVGGPVVRTLRIRNQGTQDLNLSGLTVAAPFSIDATFGDPVLSVGESTTFRVKFAPTSAGTFNTVAKFTSNDLDEGSFDFTLQGIAAAGKNIAGTVYDDRNSNGTYDSGDNGRSGLVVFLDDNDNGTLEQSGGVPVNYDNLTSQPIPDVATTTSTVNVGSFSGSIFDIDVRINLNHTWDSDLVMTLTSPGGKTVTLAQNNGGSGDNFTDTVFDDEAATSITTGTAPFTGSFRPVQALSAFDGISDSAVTGDWTLSITDTAYYDYGTLNNWTLTITPTVGEKSTKTDNDGNYFFNGLAVGTYNVRTTVPATWTLTQPAAPGKYVVSIAAPTDVNSGRDFGESHNIRGVVFLDANRNGVFDAGETPQAGWKAFADANDNGKFDAGESFGISDANGDYFISVGAAGTVKVREVIQDGWSSSTPVGGSYSVTITDPNVTSFSGKNFGNFRQVSGRIFEDRNANGVQDGTEQGQQGWTGFDDLDSDGLLDVGLSSTTNSGDAFPLDIPNDAPYAYVFGTQLVSQTVVSGTGTVYDINITLDITHAWSGDVRIQLMSPSGTTIKLFEDLGDSGGANFSNVTFDDQASKTITPPGGYSGTYKPMQPLSTFNGELGDGTWKLLVDDQHPADAGKLNSWSVNITYSIGEPFAVTDSNGDYFLGNLGAGTHKIREVLQPGWNRSTPASGVHTITVVDPNADQFLNTNFGNFKPVRGIAFHDDNVNGVMDVGEAPFAGVTIYADANNNKVLDPGESFTTTNASGNYELGGLAAGNYNIREFLPGWSLSVPTPDSHVISVVNPNADLFLNRDFGNFRQIRGTVYHDQNVNAVRDKGEAGLQGWKVYLDQNNNNVLDITQVGPTTFNAKNVPVPIVDLATSSSTMSVSGTGPVADVNVTINLTHTWDSDMVISLVAPDGSSVILSQNRGGAGDNFTNTTFDDSAATAIGAGVPPFTGTFRPDQPLANLIGVAGDGTWTLQIQDVAGGDFGSILSWSMDIAYYTGETFTASNATGDYAFGGLAAGTYTIREVLQPGWNRSQPTGGTYSVTIVNPNADNFAGRDYGQFKPIRGSVFQDDNVNAKVDAGEAPMAGVTVYVDLNDNKALDVGEPSTKSDASGNYELGGLGAGTFKIREIITGWSVSTVVGDSHSVTIVNPETDVFNGRNFGNFKQIRGRVFEDNNNNGVVNVGEAPLSGWNVYLDLNNNGVLDGSIISTDYNSADVGQALSDFTTVTSTNTVVGWGAGDVISDVDVQIDITYSYAGVLQLDLIAPNGAVVNLQPFPNFSNFNNGAFNVLFDDEATDSIVGASPPLKTTYKPAQPLSAFDGLSGSNVSGDWKLKIFDGDGYADYGTLNNWKLTLSKSVGEPIVTTDLKGNYSYGALPAGSYDVREVVQSGWNQLNPPGGKYSVTIANINADNFQNRDFGNARQNAIYGNTYLDANTNGKLDGPDTPIANVFVFDDANNNGVYDTNVTNSGPGTTGSVPDANPTGLDLTVLTAGYVGSVVDIDVNFDATMTWDGDITATLTAPDGVTTITLFSGVGGSGDDFKGTIFDDEAATPINAGSAPFSGSFQPFPGKLSAFKGLSGTNLNGTWTLHLVDNAGGDIMAVNSWSLDITTFREDSIRSDKNGNYVFTNVAPGAHHIRRITPDEMVNAQPVGNVYDVTMVAGTTFQNRDFGHVPAPTKTYIVGDTSDLDDLDTTTVAKTSIREAVRLANTDNSPSVITFDPATFVVGTKVLLTTGEMAVTKNLTINGIGTDRVILDGNALSRIFNVNIPGSTFNMSNLTLQNGNAAGNGGALLIDNEETTLTNVVITGNTATGSGGGIAITGTGGFLTLDHSTVSANTATGLGGGIASFGSSVTGTPITLQSSTISNNTSGSAGGGIFSYGGTTFTSDRSTISGNKSNGGLGGGGVFFVGDGDNATTSLFQVLNSTVSGNLAPGGAGYGGGILLNYFGASTTVIENSTIVGNDGINFGGFGQAGGTTTIASSIIATNLQGGVPAARSDLFFLGGHPPITGTHNVIGINETNTNAVFAGFNQIGSVASPIDPLLGPLAKNGGPTMTHKPLVSSPAIEQGLNFAALATDQRGVARTYDNPGIGNAPGGDGSDVGALELQPPPTVTSIVWQNGEVQRSLITSVVVTFSQPLVTLDPGAFSLQRYGTPIDLPFGSVSVSFVQGSNDATITFVNGGTVGIDPGGSLQDGQYQLTVVAAKVNGVDAPMAADATSKVHRLFGDANGSGNVDGTDFTMFRLVFGLAGHTPFDYNFDNQNNSDDFAQFRRRFGLGGYLP